MPIGEKYGGRVKGTPNKKTAEAISRAERILQLIEAEYFEDDIKKLSSGQRIDLYSSMLEYVAPKLSRQDIDVRVTKVTLEIVRDKTTLPLHASPVAAESN